MYESNDKMVSHPDHYQSKSGLEVIDVIKAFTEGLEGIEATDTGNIIKYACRWKQKNGVQDLKKIMWYTQHLIDHLESESAHLYCGGNSFRVRVPTVLDASDFLADCTTILDDYGSLLIADVQDLISNYNAVLYTPRSQPNSVIFGWFGLKGTAIEQNDFGTEIVFPAPVNVKENSYNSYSKFNKKETN